MAARRKYRAREAFLSTARNPFLTVQRSSRPFYALSYPKIVCTTTIGVTSNSCLLNRRFCTYKLIKVDFNPFLKLHSNFELVHFWNFVAVKVLLIPATMDAIIVSLVRSTGVSLSTELLDKVKETLRRLQNKLPKGSLGKGENCGTVLALEISCRLTGTAFERKALLKHVLVGENEYQKALTTCKAALDITWNFVNVTEVLAMQYSPELVEGISPILNRYQTIYVDKLPANVKSYVKLDAPLYICAAFCLVAEMKQVRLNLKMNIYELN